MNKRVFSFNKKKATKSEPQQSYTCLQSTDAYTNVFIHLFKFKMAKKKKRNQHQATLSV